MKSTYYGALLGGLALLAALSLHRPSSAETVFPGDPLPEVGVAGGPSRSLSSSEADSWLRGRLLFDRDWHQSQGLGASLNADSCRACHEDPVMGGAGGLDLNVFRYGNDQGGTGPFTQFPAGQIAKKLSRGDTQLRDEHDPSADVFEQRQSPSLLGLGLLNAIPDATILAQQDPTDLDGDGVFGVARMVGTGTGMLELGRFGWKAQIPHLSDFVHDALGVEIGITTPDDGRIFAVTSDNDAQADPETGNDEIADLAFFISHLAPPQRKGSTSPLVALGEQRFAEIGCATCHVPSLLGPDGPVNAYTNLLLHNVQPGNFRGMGEPGADVGFYRTPPLWGISDTAPYMHDGHAETLLDAIMSHFGEGDGARAAFEALPASERDAVLLFLKDL